VVGHRDGAVAPIFDLASQLHPLGPAGCDLGLNPEAERTSHEPSLGEELVHRTSYATRKSAICDITRYVELFYNRRRIHSKLGCTTPVETRQSWQKDQEAAWTCLSGISAAVQLKSGLARRPASSQKRECGRLVREFDHHAAWVRAEGGRPPTRRSSSPNLSVTTGSDRLVNAPVSASYLRTVTTDPGWGNLGAAGESGSGLLAGCV